MKKTGLDWWSNRAWILFGCCITAFMTLMILINWNTWPSEVKAMAGMSALIPIHVVEEWVFPGGFHFQYNTFLYKSDQPDRYPMCRASDMITVLSTTFMYMTITAMSVSNNGKVYIGALIGSVAFCLLEVGFHTYCGIRAYFKYKKKGKTTIYGPGSITAYLGFGSLGTIMMYNLQGKTIGTSDWLGCAAVLGLIACFCLLPEIIFKKKDSPYYFASNGYYDQFLK
ncbi:hypothetical protein IGI39_004287 [Enterococcus sp. AZ135]|uniref:HXXEE domain-containing protein n=1 Tax=unclassified Enterococcus TaxID=2608891 RepID=UPI003F1FBE76